MFANQVLLAYSHVHCGVCCARLFPPQQWQVSVVVTETIGPSGPKISLLSPFAGKLYLLTVGRQQRLGSGGIQWFAPFVGVVQWLSCV